VKARAEQGKAEQLQQQSVRFDQAVNNIPQGLMMFDAAARIAVYNERYLQMYGLSPEVVQPGLAFIELIKYRAKIGSLKGDPYEYSSQVLKQIAEGQTTSALSELADGRTIRVTNQPMADGGWVATHEDITDKVHAENEIKLQKHHLDTALENISQGLCMYDASQRLIICNKRYADLYELNDKLISPARHFARSGATNCQRKRAGRSCTATSEAPR
jgi:PAS domain S-box-containing protein